jgi:hypothetical protein
MRGKGSKEMRCPYIFPYIMRTTKREFPYKSLR